MDLISCIVNLWETSTFRPNLEHVYGHSDEIPFQILTPIQQLNIRLDKKAKEIALRHMKTPGHSPPDFYHSYGLGTITCHNQYISSHLQSSLYDSVLYSRFLDYLSSVFQIPHNTIQENVSWTCFCKARHRAKFSIFKFI